MASPDEKISFIANVPLFRGLNNRQLKKLATRFVGRAYKPGEAIVTQGKGGEGMFTIVSGKADVIRQFSDGSEVKVNHFEATDFFGEIALLDDGLRTASVIATEETECLVLSRSDFIAAMKNDAEMGVTISQALAQRMRRALESI